MLWEHTHVPRRPSATKRNRRLRRVSKLSMISCGLLCPYLTIHQDCNQDLAILAEKLKGTLEHIHCSHVGPLWCSRRECKLRMERERAKEALHKTCTNCDVDLYITMCCAEDKELCEDCCSDLFRHSKVIGSLIYIFMFFIFRFMFRFMFLDIIVDHIALFVFYTLCFLFTLFCSYFRWSGDDL